MRNEKLTFRLTNDNRPLREQSLEGSILTEQYKYALRQINEYLGELKLENISQPDHIDFPEHQRQQSETIGIDTDYNNNIFAFIGDRGSGKTSCMITVADFLIRKNEVLPKQEYPYIDKVNFATIDLIDPTYFDNAHNLISLFLAKLHKSFLKKSEEYERDVRHTFDKSGFSEDTRNRFLDRFRRTQENLYHVMDIIKYDNNQDLLEFVDGLSASINLKENIEKLVDLYLDYIGIKDAVLILRIDDVDINEQQASVMVEAMRKYFIQPNILVLLSLKLKQLEDIKFLELKKFYSDNVSFSNDDIRDMVEKYVVKLIPRSHRILMPQYDYYHGKALEVEYYNLFDTDTDGKRRLRTLKFSSVRQAVPQLIFWKTRYLFYNSILQESFIVPENLRELRQLIKLLVTLPDYRIIEVDENFSEIIKETNEINKDIFKNYFFETWLPNNLPATLMSDALKLVNEGTDFNFNALVLNILNNRYNTPKGSSQKTYIESTPTFGEVLTEIHKIEKKVSLPADKKFLFFIKSLYSIKLYEAYDVLTGDHAKSMQHGKDEIFIEGTAKDSPNRYLQLTRGALFSAEDELGCLSFDFEIDQLNEFVNICLDLYAKKPGNDDDAYGGWLAEMQIRCQWIEVLMLCINFTDKPKFDIGYLFGGLPFMFAEENAYVHLKRGDELWKIICDRKRGFKTLRDEFAEATISMRLRGDASKFDIHRWQSFCTIRNIEVLEGLLTFVKRGIYTGTEYANLLEFFKSAVDFFVKSYDRDEEGKIEPYKIDFKFLEKVTNLMLETDREENNDIKIRVADILIGKKSVQDTIPADQQASEIKLDEARLTK